MIENHAPRLAPQAKPRRFRAPLALAIGIGALAATASVASASECINGYLTLGNDVIVLCEAAGPAGSTALFPGAAPPPAPVPQSRSGSMMADSVEDCLPGKFWTLETEGGGDLLMACR